MTYDRSITLEKPLAWHYGSPSTLRPWAGLEVAIE